MKWISDSRILIVGLGLIGGSYAKGLKRLGYHVTAIDTRKEAIDYALENHIINEGFTEVTEEVVSSADAVIFGLYPKVFLEWIERYQKFFKPGTMLTDVTGVKSCIVYKIQDMLRDDVEFIGSHPMAGREVYGVENADENIFRGANFILTPTEKNSPASIRWVGSLARILGFGRISVLSPEEHDEMIGYLSQLTHCIAVALMTCSDNEHLVDYTGDSFRDLTRIANINDVMWSELFMLNRESLLKYMDIFLDEFAALRDMVRDGNVPELREKMKLSTKRRAYFNRN
ncbi:MAG: prephenate dehydrogenase [Ruminococcus sp.]|nr:prephenate dehydrogenase [Ruminococcus sp.]